MLRNHGLQQLIAWMVPSILGACLLVWAFNRLARRFNWKRRAINR
jgi:uncharacterized membrane protein YeaQ/YmgE (transglycosylase-associated protein family)